MSSGSESVDLVTFLRARLDERAQTARAAGGEEWQVWDDDGPVYVAVAASGDDVAETIGDYPAECAEHIARWDPATVLRDIEAKRGVIRLYENALAAQRQGSVSGCNRTQDAAAVDVLRVAVGLLALPHAEHPDHQEEWDC